MDPIEVTATATVMIASKPGGKPTPHVITAAYADELITALCAAKTACIAGQAALEAAAEALAGREDGDVVDATIYCGAVAPHSGVPCSLPEHGREVRHEHQRPGRPAIVWDADTWTSADPAGADAKRSDDLAAAHPLRCGNPACEHPEGVHYMGGRTDMITRHCLDEGCLCAAFSAPTGFAQTLDAAAVLAASIATGQPILVDDDEVITAPPDPGWRDPVTGLMSGPTYEHLNRLSCGCTFAGPLTWPAGRKARCDSHGEVTTVAAEPPAPVSFLRRDQRTLAGVKIGGAS